MSFLKIVNLTWITNFARHTRPLKKYGQFKILLRIHPYNRSTDFLGRTEYQLDSQPHNYRLIDWPTHLALLIIIFIYCLLPVKAYGAETSASTAPPISELILGLEQKLKDNETDAEGWALLAKSYHYLGRWQDAGVAMERAKALGYNGQLPSVAKRAPQPIKVRLDSHGNNWLEDYIAKTKSEKKDDSAEKSSVGSIQVQVTIEEDLKSSATQSSLVYVFARENNKTGPPLAVKKFLVNELPMTLELNDADAILPSHNISSATSIIVGARLSITGSPTRTKGDYEYLSPLTDYASAQPVTIQLTKSSIIKQALK